MIKKIKKRNGKEIEFSQDKITRAIFLAASSVAKKLQEDVDYDEACRLSDLVVEYLNKIYSNSIPSVEQVQDAVIRILIENGHVNTSQAYILYRNERNIDRNRQSIIIKKIKEIRNNNSDISVSDKFNEYGKIVCRQNNLSLIDDNLENEILNNNIYIDDLAYLLENVDYIQIVDLNEFIISNTAVESIFKLLQTLNEKSENISGYLIVKNFDLLINQIKVQLYNEINSKNSIISYSQFKKLNLEDKQLIEKKFNLVIEGLINNLNKNIYFLTDEINLKNCIKTKYEKFFNKNITHSITINGNKKISNQRILCCIKEYLNIYEEDNNCLLIKILSDNINNIEQLTEFLKNEDIEFKITNILSEECNKKWQNKQFNNSFDFIVDENKLVKVEK